MEYTTLFEGSRYANIPKMSDTEHGLMVLPACPVFKRLNTYTVRAGETLSGLAIRFYGQPSYIWAIVVSNELPFPARLASGMSLLIPDRDEVYSYTESGVS